jgi:hypothetical protein
MKRELVSLRGMTSRGNGLPERAGGGLSRRRRRLRWMGSAWGESFTTLKGPESPQRLDMEGKRKNHPVHEGNPKSERETLGSWPGEMRQNGTERRDLLRNHGVQWAGTARSVPTI